MCCGLRLRHMLTAGLDNPMDRRIHCTLLSLHNSIPLVHISITCPRLNIFHSLIGLIGLYRRYSLSGNDRG